MKQRPMVFKWRNFEPQMQLRRWFSQTPKLLIK